MAQAAAIPQPVNLYTWNSLGNFTSGSKPDELSQMLAGPALALVLIQEGGVKLAGEKDGYTAVSGYAVGAFNERCTNYVLFNDAWPRRISEVVLVNANGGALIGGGVAGRTTAAVGIDRTLFISWHSLSGPNDLDTSALIFALQTAPTYAQQYDLIALGGDFNASPDDVQQIINGIASNERIRTNFYAQVVNCGQPTFKKADKEIDFFVIFRAASQQESPAQLYQMAASDHDAVATALLVPV